MQPLHRKYHPQDWSEVTGQDGPVSAIRESLRRGWGARAWWIVGSPGTGCTTIAFLLAREGAEKNRVLSVAGDKVDLALVMRMAKRDRGDQGVGPHAYIIDRPNWVPPTPLGILTTVLPCLPETVCVVFTITPPEEVDFLSQAEDALQVRSMCERVQLNTEGLEEPFARRCKGIAEKEGLGGKGIRSYLKLARDCQCDFRQMLNKIEQGMMARQPHA